MTTSVLLAHVGYLNSHDIHTLRDFALEAPDPWRNVLTNLIDGCVETYDASTKAELLQAKLDDINSDVKSVAGHIRTEMTNLREVFAQRGLIPESTLTEFELAISEQLSILEGD